MMSKNSTDHELFGLREWFTFTSYIYEILCGNIDHYELTLIMLFVVTVGHISNSV